MEIKAESKQITNSQVFVVGFFREIAYGDEKGLVGQRAVSPRVCGGAAGSCGCPRRQDWVRPLVLSLRRKPPRALPAASYSTCDRNSSPGMRKAVFRQAAASPGGRWVRMRGSPQEGGSPAGHREGGTCERETKQVLSGEKGGNAAAEPEG